MKFQKDQWIYLVPLALLVVGVTFLIFTPDLKKPSREVASKITEPVKTEAKSLVAKQKKEKVNKKNKSQENKKNAKKIAEYDPNKNWDQQFDALKKIEECYNEEGRCGFPNTDPKSEYFAIGKRLSQDLLKMQGHVSRLKVKDEQISAISRHFLKVSDGFVKKAALHLLATQPTSEQNLESLLQNIIGYHDAYLIEQGLLEIARYMGSEENENKIHSALVQAMKTGSPFVGEQISRKLNPFINERSLPLYLRTMRNLSKGSLTHKNLKNAINEYQRLAQSA